MKETYDRLKKKNMSNDQFDRWLVNPNTKKIFSAENLAEIKKMWYAKNTAKPVNKNKYTDMTKDQLDEYSINTYGIDLDKRYTKENMIDELEEELKKKNEEE